MIKKFKTIGNLAVFQNFEWDKSVLDKDGNALEFKQINILYGRNYSGKTTLSRILRAIESGTISDKFENPAFCVAFADNSEIKQDTLTGHGKKVRVFNDDFIRDNLKFITNPSESIEPFAILGIDNLKIEEEIKVIETEIGSKEEGKETGLCAQLKNENKNLTSAQDNHQARQKQLDLQLQIEATDRVSGIKYKSDKFGDQNYSQPKLEKEIPIVLDATFTAITNEEQAKLEKIITETTNDVIPALPRVSLNINRFLTETESLIQQKIGESGKIEELVKGAVLNRWVKEGRELHKGKRTKCAFCDNDIEPNRWVELEKHFDEMSEKLEQDIDKLIKKIDLEIVSVTNCFKPNKTLFYTKFHSEIERTITAYNLISEKYNEQLTNLKKQLHSRMDDLINPKIFVEASNYSKRVEWIFGIYENFRVASNNYSTSLSTDQTNAKTLLRLREVLDFAVRINYSAEVEAIQKLENKAKEVKEKRDKIANEISEKNTLIESKRRELKDESKGADKVNEYLSNFFGHGFLSLQAIEFESADTPLIKKLRFDVIRDKKKAYHLSEGECSLIAFCYFMAKLEDIDTKGSKPIIWIDDPISSLDANHIFFVYSILDAEIVSKNAFEQLFISTHNLDFLKYLKRLTGQFANSNKKKEKYSKSYFVVLRQDKIASLSIMPQYLKDFVTEFNYMFHQIYKCSKIAAIDDSNYTTFYNFGNNARKFLEIYLYYKYPDNTAPIEKLQKFFGEKIPAVLTDRINNEYSHLSAAFERGATPVEVPEMKSAAELIIQKIKETDEEQYMSLLCSIEETP